MSTTAAVGPRTPVVDQSPKSCGMKVSKALTIVGGVLAGVVALAESTRFLDLAPIADLFQHLPSSQTNVVVGVAAVATMIAGQVLVGVEERKEKTRTEQQAKVKAEADKLAAEEAKKKIVLLDAVIQLFEKVANRVHEVHQHPQTKAAIESKRVEGQSAIERQLQEYAEQKLPKSRFTVSTVSQADTKLSTLLNQTVRFLATIKAVPESINALSMEDLNALKVLANWVGDLTDTRLHCLDKKIAVFEKTFEEIMGRVDTLSGDNPIAASIGKLLNIWKEVEDFINSISVPRFSQ